MPTARIPVGSCDGGSGEFPMWTGGLVMGNPMLAGPGVSPCDL